MRVLKRLSSRLPAAFQEGLKRNWYAGRIRFGRFAPDEPEAELVPSILRPGDVVLDIGANVGHYTALFSRCVGPTGRVIAFEPVPDTFRLLACNARLFAHDNVTLLNAAVSEITALVNMVVPVDSHGYANFYRAQISDGPGRRVLSLKPDGLQLPAVRLIKIDAEGHELAVLHGLLSLLERDHPVLIIEDSSPAISEILVPLGYVDHKYDGSPNRTFRLASEEIPILT